MFTIHHDRLADAAQLASLLWPQTSAAELTNDFEAMLASGKACVLTAEEEGESIGFAQCQLRHDYVEGVNSSPVGYLEGVYVKEPHRGQGVGRALAEACEAWAAAHGCIEFASDCELDNEVSQVFHESIGFEEVGRIVCFCKKLPETEQAADLAATPSEEPAAKQPEMPAVLPEAADEQPADVPCLHDACVTSIELEDSILTLHFGDNGIDMRIHQRPEETARICTVTPGKRVKEIPLKKLMKRVNSGKWRMEIVDIAEGYFGNVIQGTLHADHKPYIKNYILETVSIKTEYIR